MSLKFWKNGLSWVIPPEDVLEGCCAILWSVWHERNNRVFQNEDKEVSQVIEAIKFKVTSWLVAEEAVQSMGVSDLIRIWCEVAWSKHRSKVIKSIPWCASGEDQLKANFDRSSNPSKGAAGYGGVIHNSREAVVLSFSGSLQFCHANEAELFALSREELKSLRGWVRMVTFWKGTPCYSVARGIRCPWKYLDKVEEIQQITKKKRFNISHIHRSASSKADRLAKDGRITMVKSVSECNRWGGELGP